MNSFGRVALCLTFLITYQAYSANISQLVQRQQAAAMAWHDRMFKLPARHSLGALNDAELSQLLDDQMGRMILLSGVGIISAACFCGAAGSILSTHGFGFAGKTALQWCKGCTGALGKRVCLGCSMPVTALIVYKCGPAIYQKWCFIQYIKKLQRERAQDRTAKRDFEQKQAHEREVKEKLDSAKQDLQQILQEQEKLRKAGEELLRASQAMQRNQRKSSRVMRDIHQALVQESQDIRVQLRQTQEAVIFLAEQMQHRSNSQFNVDMARQSKIEFQAGSNQRVRNRMLLRN